ncbi:MAG: GNAT family N-acetyltransferase [Oscillochloridaceae bacterium umkhey_bin13]
MQIIDPSTLAMAPWPPNDAGRPMLEALVREGPAPFIRNVRARMLALAIDGAVMPLVQVDAPPTQPNAYVCSPTTHYVDYAQREVALELADQPALRHLLPPLLELLRPLLRLAQAERAVYVNNWLLSTNLYPPLSATAPATLVRGLVAAYPTHLIVFRSLNHALNGPLINQLVAAGCLPVFSRQVYLLDPRDGAFRRRNNYGHDRRLARRSGYRWRDGASLPPQAAVRMRTLYDQLYLEKYSPYNPQLTAYAIARAMQSGWLNVSVLEQDGQLDGVLGTISQHGVITAPVVGYERQHDERTGLYRLLMLALIEQATANQQILHFSSGAASFKRLRGAEGYAEYSLIYAKHLPAAHQAPWRLLAALSEQVIIPLMQRYGL